MNRRGFFGLTAAAIGWLWGAKAEAIALPPLTLGDIKAAPKVNSAEWSNQVVKFDYSVPVMTPLADGTFEIRYEIRTGTLRKLDGLPLNFGGSSCP